MNVAEVAFMCLVTTALIGMGCSVAAFRSFDRLLRIEHLKHRGEWERDGSPIGFFWFPNGAKVFSGSFVRSELISTWASAKPAWVEGDVEALAAYATFKRLFRFTSRVTLTFIGGFALFWMAIIVFLIR